MSKTDEFISPYKQHMQPWCI